MIKNEIYPNKIVDLANINARGVGRMKTTTQQFQKGIYQADQEIAKRMIAMGFDNKAIEEMTGFSEEELNKLQ